MRHLREAIHHIYRHEYARNKPPGNTAENATRAKLAAV
jgi:hypothetical protein